jgi:iron complex outermembrane receptor protein
VTRIVSTRQALKTSLFSGAALFVLAAASVGAAHAAEDPTETIVITGTKFNTDAAPAKASLETTEPQTIINRSYIENFMSPQQDYNGILAIVPGMTGSDPAGPGLSDGGAKNTLRGFQDGFFAMQYDGIPFGDTNGPSHHSISYFPASTIGSAVVDRGPGNAGNLGAATYGGTVKLFSPVLTSDFQGTAVASGGSYQTMLGNVAAQSGNVDFLGKTRVLASVQGLTSNSTLSLQNVETKNAMLKTESDLNSDWRVTLFGSYSFLKEHLSDNNGLTPAQIAAYGKNFALQNTDPTLPTFYGYNYTTKQTDFEYAKVNGQITDNVKLENTLYTYAYWNHTFSPNSQTQTSVQIAADTSSDNGTVTLLNGNKLTNSLLAYDKENAYRVYGDILRVTDDFHLGSVNVEARAGVWLEDAETRRFKYYFDANLCASLGVNPFAAGLEPAAAACGAKKGNGFNGSLGYAKDDEGSSWQQFQPFAEIEIKPTEDLTLTPGVKYIHWDHKVDSPVEQGSLCGVSVACGGFNTLGQNFQESFTTTDTLPFFQANYKINRNWSVYAEYAKGIYVPDISVFENSTPLAPVGIPRAQTTTNYQVGTVYYADSFTFDVDGYYIPINNNYVTLPCTVDINDTCYVNIGQATYKGLEGEGTLQVEHLGGLQTPGLSIFVNGALMSSKQQNGLWVPNAPKYTAAGGLLYRHDGWKFGLIDKLVGSQYTDAANNPTYIIKTYNSLSATFGYEWDNYAITYSVDNVLDSRAVVALSQGGTGTSLATSTDQYQFQAPLFMSLSFRANF